MAMLTLTKLSIFKRNKQQKIVQEDFIKKGGKYFLFPVFTFFLHIVHNFFAIHTYYDL